MKIYVFAKGTGDGSVRLVYTKDKDFFSSICEAEDYPYDPYEDFGANETPSVINLPDDFDIDTLGVKVYETAEEYLKEYN